MMVSVLSARVVGVWICVGSSTTWCHLVCMFCDPVVTFQQTDYKAVEI
jgi:hypothetical protein